MTTLSPKKTLPEFVDGEFSIEELVEYIRDTNLQFFEQVKDLLKELDKQLLLESYKKILSLCTNQGICIIFKFTIAN